MLRSVESLYGYKIQATDGDIGKVHDIFFDDENWAVRYFIADTGSWLSGKKVLIFPIAVAHPNWKHGTIPVGLSKERIENSPTTDTDIPVSRQHEIELHSYFNWAPYWPATGVPYGSLLPPMTDLDKQKIVEQEDTGDPHLRSTREVTGYDILATDGSIGHAKDLIVDEDGWTIRYLVIDTRNWLPGQKVIISPEWIKKVSWAKRGIYVDLPQDEIKNAPEYDPSQPVNREYEMRLYDYYGRPVYF